jgi:hypothetical protein
LKLALFIIPSSLPLHSFGFLIEYTYLCALNPKSNLMRIIKFTEEEISSLYQIYIEKLAQAEKEIQRIKDVLKKLEVSTFNKHVEEEPIVIKKEHKPKVKDTKLKIQKKHGRIPKVVVPDESVSETVVTESKKRGRKPKTVVVEPTVPKKRGRKPKIVVPAVESVPETVVKEPKKRGRKPKAVSVPTGEPKKRGRKPKVSIESAPEPEPVPTNKERKKIAKKRSPYRKNRKWRGVRLTPLSKPIKLKEPKEKLVDEITPEVEPVVPPTMETITAQIEEQTIVPTEESKE